MEQLLAPVVDSVTALTTEGIPLVIELDVLSALLLALALSVPVIVYFAGKSLTK